jgi:hypothetical protein
MVSVPASIHLEKRRTLGEFLFEPLVELDGVTSLRKESVNEVDVRSVLLVIELVGTRMRDDECAALLHERSSSVEVEEVTLGENLHQQRVQERMHVVRADVRNARDEHVGLTLDRHHVLLETPLERLLVHRFGGPRVDAGDAIGGGKA